MIRAAILLTLAACASSKSAEQHAEVGLEAHGATHAEEQSAASGRTTAGPETITTTVEEFKYVAPEEGYVPAPEGVRAAEVDRLTVPRRQPATTLPDSSVLVKRTVTVDQRGPVDTSWMANASGTQGAEQQTTLQANSASKSASKRSYWPPVTYLLVGLLAVAAGLWLARGKLKLALGVLGRIF